MCEDISIADDFDVWLGVVSGGVSLLIRPAEANPTLPDIFQTVWSMSRLDSLKYNVRLSEEWPIVTLWCRELESSTRQAPWDVGSLCLIWRVPYTPVHGSWGIWRVLQVASGCPMLRLATCFKCHVRKVSEECAGLVERKGPREQYKHSHITPPHSMLGIHVTGAVIWRVPSRITCPTDGLSEECPTLLLWNLDLFQSWDHLKSVSTPVRVNKKNSVNISVFGTLAFTPGKKDWLLTK